jgi:adenine/guanine phosphoribosyltransferase-like PRPP-binding protein
MEDLVGEDLRQERGAARVAVVDDLLATGGQLREVGLVVRDGDAADTSRRW